MTQFLEFTQYVRPNGRQVPVHFEADDEAKEIYYANKTLGFDYSVELLDEKTAALYISDNNLEVDLVTEIRTHNEAFGQNVTAFIKRYTPSTMQEYRAAFIAAEEAGPDDWDDYDYDEWKEAQ